MVGKRFDGSDAEWASSLEPLEPLALRAYAETTKQDGEQARRDHIHAEARQAVVEAVKSQQKNIRKGTLRLCVAISISWISYVGWRWFTDIILALNGYCPDNNSIVREICAQEYLRHTFVFAAMLPVCLFTMRFFAFWIIDGLQN